MSGDAVTLRELFEQRFRAIEEARRDHQEKVEAALKLQAEEYKRRLDELNGEYKRDAARQALYVTVDKFEGNLASEKTAREAALLRVDEKFQDYVKRYEQRQREIDLLLAAQDGAARAAKEAAEQQGRLAVKAAEDASRRSNRNIAIVGLVLTAIIAVAQFWGTQETGTKIDEAPPVTTTGP